MQKAMSFFPGKTSGLKSRVSMKMLHDCCMLRAHQDTGSARWRRAWFNCQILTGGKGLRLRTSRAYGHRRPPKIRLLDSRFVCWKDRAGRLVGVGKMGLVAQTSNTRVLVISFRQLGKFSFCFSPWPDMF